MNSANDVESYKAQNRLRYDSHSSAEKFTKSAAKRRYTARLGAWAAANAPAGARLLDVGGGVGEQVRALLALRPDVRTIGLDLSKVVLSERVALYGLPAAVQGDMEQLPFADSSFDAVAFFAALHHSHRPIRVLEEVRRVLTGAGRLLLAEPISLRMMLAGRTGFAPVGDDVNFKFSLRFVLDRVRASGFTVDSVQTIRISGRALLPVFGRTDWVFRVSDALDDAVLRHVPIVRTCGAVAMISATRQSSAT